MVVIGKRAVGVLDDDVVAERLKFRVGPADGGIVAHSDDPSFARRANRCALGHIPVDRVLTA